MLLNKLAVAPERLRPPPISPRHRAEARRPNRLLSVLFAIYFVSLAGSPYAGLLEEGSARIVRIAIILSPVVWLPGGWWLGFSRLLQNRVWRPVALLYLVAPALALAAERLTVDSLGVWSAYLVVLGMASWVAHSEWSRELIFAGVMATLTTAIVGLAHTAVTGGLLLPGLSGLPRLTGFGLSPNFVGQAALIGLLVRRDPRRGPVNSLDPLRLLLIGALLLSDSRGAVLIAAPLVAGSVLLSKSDRSRSAVMWTAAGFGAVVLSIGLSGGIYPSIGEGSAELISRGEDGVSLTDSGGRQDVWGVVYEEARSQPWAGHGLGSAREELPELIPVPSWSPAITHAHQQFLHWFYEFGIFGVAAFAVFGSRLVRIAWECPLALAFLGLCLVETPVGTTSPTQLFFVLVVLGFGCRQQAAERCQQWS